MTTLTRALGTSCERSGGGERFKRRAKEEENGKKKNLREKEESRSQTALSSLSLSATSLFATSSFQVSFPAFLLSFYPRVYMETHIRVPYRRIWRGKLRERAPVRARSFHSAAPPCFSLDARIVQKAVLEAQLWALLLAPCSWLFVISVVKLAANDVRSTLHQKKGAKERG